MACSEHARGAELDTFLEDVWINHMKFPQSNLEVQTLTYLVKQMVSNLVEKIDFSNLGWTVKNLIPVGSMAEGTRICLPDEFDFMVVVEQFDADDTFKSVVSSEEGTFVEFRPECILSVKCLGCMYNCSCASERKRCSCDDYSYWSAAGKQLLCDLKGKLVQMIQNGSFYSVPSFPGRLRPDDGDVLKHGPAAMFYLIWETHHTGEEPKSLQISVDLVPVIEIKTNPLFRKTLDVFHQKFSEKFRDTNTVHITPLMLNRVEETFGLCKVSFALSEFELMRSESETHKKCYMLLKYIYKTEHYMGDFYTSFVFKNLVLQHSARCETHQLGLCLLQILCHLKHTMVEQDRPFIPHIFNRKHILLQLRTFKSNWPESERQLSHLIEKLEKVRDGWPIWSVTREKGHSDICVKCRLGSAYAVRTG